MSALPPLSADRPAVAIVGIGCRLPGGVRDAAGLWQLLLSGQNAVGEVPPSRFDLAHYFDARPATPGRTMTRHGGFLADLQGFDAAFFGIAPREAERMDPQQRLWLETAWEALEDAGIPATGLDGSATGVFVGQWLSDFESRLFADPEQLDFSMTTGSGRYATSGRLSYLLGLRGPSLSIDTACSSSLVAVHLAIRSLREGECTLALAGGVNVILQPHISVAYSQSRMMAPDGRCKFGDAHGDGYVRSEGAGVVVLKPLAAALADGDRVYAVIRGSAVNNDGHSSGSMGTPSREGQQALLRRAYADAGVSPACLGYVEAHGTGTRAGDPVELGALGAVLGEGRAGQAPGTRTRVGSIKTNIGHTEGAAGVAGLIKVALALHHARIPASLHCSEPNPAVDWAAAPFEIARTASDWMGAERLGGVSAFGIAGTNAHVVLQSAPPTVREGSAPALPARPSLLVLSARGDDALRALAAAHAQALDGVPQEQLQAHCLAAATRRSALEDRAVFMADDAPAMTAQLRAFAAGDAEAAVASGKVVGPALRGPVFVLPGQGGQWVGMARGLLASEPEFARAMHACDAAARPWLRLSLVEQLQLEPDNPACRLRRIELVQPALVAYAIAAARWLATLGIRPAAVVGHSMGEVAAAHLAGVLSLDEAMRIICRRSALMGRTSGRGAMAMVELAMADAQQRLGGREALLSVAVNNSPRSCVVSGEPRALQALVAELEAEGVFCRAIQVDVASHSPQMDGCAAELVAELADPGQPLRPRPAVLPLHSMVLARVAEGHEFDAAYWGRNLRQPVRFAETVGGLMAEGARVFVELGPHPVLTTALQQTAQSLPTAAGAALSVLGFGHRERLEQRSALALVAGLWTAGQVIDWPSVLAPGAGQVTLPPYPWQREPLWVRQARTPSPRHGAGGVATAPIPVVTPEQQTWLHRPQWQSAELTTDLPGATASTPGRWLLVGRRPHDLAPLQDGLRSMGLQVRSTGLDGMEAALRGEGTGAGAALGVLLCVDDEREALFDPVTVLQALLRAGPGCTGRLWLVTAGAVDASAPRAGGGAEPGRGPRIAVWAGAAWGIGRVMAEEHPECFGGLIDLDPTCDGAGRAAQLARELATGGVEPQVAWRGHERLVLRLVPLVGRGEDLEPAPVAWRTDAAYLITGGLGGLGLQVAAAMVAQGARRIVLLGRSGLPPRERWSDQGGHDARTERRIAAVLALEAQGTAVHVLQADVACVDALREALDSYAAARFPAIRGVIHAAGVTEDHLLADLDRASLERVCAPKLDGAMHLDRLLPDLDLFVAFSSMTATLCWPGMANYVAANVGLDALVADRRARGRPGLSIQWGPWEGLGLWAGGAARFNAELLARQGVFAFSAEVGATLFVALAGRGDSPLTVMPTDWPTLLAARRGRKLNLFAEYAKDLGAGSSGGPSLAQRLPGLAPSERVTLLTQVVREAVGRVLKLAPERIDVSRPLGHFGLNSLMAMELRNRLEATLGRALSATLAWNYPTVQALVGFLVAHDPHGDSAATRGPHPGASEPASRGARSEAAGLAEVVEVAELSDGEAARLLRRRR